MGLHREGLSAVDEPALLIRRVTPPAISAALATDAGSVMSRAITLAPGRSTESGLRAPAYTVAPRLSSSLTRWRPSPRLAPVTRAVDRAIFMTSP